jgi:hypothetical protein
MALMLCGKCLFSTSGTSSPEDAEIVYCVLVLRAVDQIFLAASKQEHAWWNLFPGL